MSVPPIWFPPTLYFVRQILSVDPSEVPLSHINQFAVGWMRAAFEQSRFLTKLTKMGMGNSAASNRRTF